MQDRLAFQKMSAFKEAKNRGMASSEANLFVDDHLTEYRKQELVRKAVYDVQVRGFELDQKRKLQSKAYSGVKSKIARNMKVIDRTNKDLGYSSNPYNNVTPRR